MGQLPGIGCLVPGPEAPDSYLRGLFPQHLAPVNYHPLRWEVKLNASECTNARGGDKAGVSHSHLSLNSHPGEGLISAGVEDVWAIGKQTRAGSCRMG